MLPRNSHEAKKTAVHLLHLRSYSESEIRSKLGKRGYSKDAVDGVVTWLIEERYLNDERLCNNLVELYSNSKKYSRRMIIAKLKQRGIQENLIRESLKNYDESLEAEAAFQLAARRFKEFDISKDKNRLIRYLASRGFSAGTVSKVITSLECNAPG